MFRNKHQDFISVNGVPHKKQVLLADVNIPYKLCVDRNTNCLFFCINADESCDQSFQSAVLELETNVTYIVPSVPNGFAAAVDQTSGDVFLGGSQGIFKYNFITRDIDKPAMIAGIDVFDMCYLNNLYFVDTANQNLFVYRNNKISVLKEVNEHLVHHFTVDYNEDILFVSPSGVYLLSKGAKRPILVDGRDILYRGATTDLYGIPHLIAEDSIYSFDKKDNQLIRIASIENGYGLAFDKNNKIVYSDERSVIKLV